MLKNIQRRNFLRKKCLQLNTFARVGYSQNAQINSNSIFKPVQWKNQITNANLFNKGEALKVHWKTGEKSEFHAAWLRYNCSSNREKNSGDRAYMSAEEVDPSSKISNIYQKEKSLRVDFEGGHTSEFDSSWLWQHSHEVEMALRNSGSPNTLEWKTNKRRFPECGTLQEFLETDEGKWNVLQSINQDGFAVIDATASEDPYNAIEQVGTRIGGRLQTTNFDRVFDVFSRVQFPMNAAYTCCHLDIHQDLQVWESPPGIQALHCLANDEERITGGESTLVDLFGIANRIREEDPEAFEILCTVPVTFERINEVSHYRYTTPHISVSPFTGQINQVRWYPFSEAPLVSLKTAEEVATYYRAYEKFVTLVHSEEHTIAYRLKKGQIVAFNNRRMGHGRRAFVQQEGAERHLRGVYVNIDDFASEYWTMAKAKAEETGYIMPIYPTGNNSY